MLRWFRSKMSNNLTTIDEDEDGDSKQEAKNNSPRSMFSDTTDDKASEKCDWDPPKTHGLGNSFPILQQAYIR